MSERNGALVLAWKACTPRPKRSINKRQEEQRGSGEEEGEWGRQRGRVWASPRSLWSWDTSLFINNTRSSYTAPQTHTPPREGEAGGGGGSVESEPLQLSCQCVHMKEKLSWGGLSACWLMEKMKLPQHLAVMRAVSVQWGGGGFDSHGSTHRRLTTRTKKKQKKKPRRESWESLNEDENRQKNKQTKKDWNKKSREEKNDMKSMCRERRKFTFTFSNQTQNSEPC